MPRGQSLYSKYPDYRVDLETHPERVRVRFADETVVDTTRALLVRETRHQPVYYFPREDVDMRFLERSEHESFCPFKGQASYWSLVGAGRREENVVWSYEDPFDEVVGLKDCVAFYDDRVEIVVGEGQAR